VGGSIAGRAALTRLGLGVEPSALLERAALLAMPVLPSAVSVALVKIGIASPAQFVATEPGTLVEPLNTLLAGRLERPIAVADVAAWQARVRRAIAVPLPDTTSR
jgi:hypothetical protein